ncbi:sulfatase-like hydrolase/transferase [Erythrobacter aureus]|uniref:Sulfatase N-terminal domain-containing protein n=1 Tax=Erythrobacter aureus TaxID=2182384 RepID=A0A345YII5_9SPHN|nr:sulfatase-like hydrolase/transferase [Erythrobacter aureus]AXK43737.1 hypothetical protein DVR09_14870 [Erythrobacter aureus]
MSVLVISIDDLAAFSIVKSLYGGTVHTPNIDRLMAMGTTFENGFSQVALCNPSRTSAMTGLSPAHTGVHQNATSYHRAVEPQDILMSDFMEAGYETSMIGKVLHAMRVPEDYASQFLNHIFDDRTDVGGHQIGVLDESLRSVNGDEVNVAHAIEMLSAYTSGDNFAMFVGINKPHLNWEVPQEFYDMYPIEEVRMVDWDYDDLLDLPGAALSNTGENRWSIDPSEAGPEAMQAYLAAISYADYLLGQILDQVEASGLSDSVTIALWTDHGYHLGDKDQWGKFTLWDTGARAPFIIAQPGTDDDGQVVSQVVELTDLMPTLMDLEGLQVPDGIDGRSLVDFINDPSLMDDGIAITTMNGDISLRTNEWRYTRYANGQTELYAAEDTANLENLAGDPAYADIIATLDAQLRAEASADGWVIGSTDGILYGTDANEAFTPYHEHTIHGGGGDDLYQLEWTSPYSWATVVELEDGGYDTIRTNQHFFVIPDNVEEVHQLKANGIVIGNALDNFIIGGEWVDGRDGNDIIDTGRGDDTILPGRGDDTINGGFGFDTLDYSQVDSAIRVRWGVVTSETDGRDTYLRVESIIGTGFSDDIWGSNNAEVFRGGFGKDSIRGFQGNDAIYGDGGSDKLRGDEGDDLLDGGSGWDTLLGGEGDDTLHGGNGNDFLIGHNGHDTLHGDAGHDILRGADGNDQLEGGSGHDSLFGGIGIDILVGGDGDDVLAGQWGADILTGGAGSDTFVFDNPDIARWLTIADQITDFEIDQDIIDLSGIDAIIDTQSDDAFTFIGREQFTGIAGELRYYVNENQTFLAADYDGDGKADLHIVLDGQLDLTAEHFIL